MLAFAVNGQSSSLVAYWDFNEGSGLTAQDSTGNGNTGELLNGVSWTNDGISGNALHFDGIDDKVHIVKTGSIDLIQQVRIEAWVKRDSQQDGLILSKNGPYYLSVLQNKVTGGVYAGNPCCSWVYAQGNTDLQVGQWYNLAMSYDGTKVRVFINGVEDNEAPQTGNMPAVSQNIFIGWGEPGQNQFFQGTIDEVKLYSKAGPQRTSLTPPKPEICNDRKDNDHDGLIDCQDPDCSTFPACIEVCDDGVDNDQDGRTDCADADCAGFPACQEAEHCNDGIDNDNDGKIDCDDIDNCGGTCIRELQEKNQQLEQRTSILEQLVQKIINWIKLFTQGKMKRIP